MASPALDKTVTLGDANSSTTNSPFPVFKLDTNSPDSQQQQQQRPNQGAPAMLNVPHAGALRNTARSFPSYGKLTFMMPLGGCSVTHYILYKMLSFFLMNHFFLFRL